MRIFFILLLSLFVKLNFYAANARQQSYGSLLERRNTIGAPEAGYYIDRSGRSVYYGKPYIKKKLDITYLIDGKSYNSLVFSIRPFFTERILSDDIFDNLSTNTNGSNYRGAISISYRLLNLGYPYPSSVNPDVYLPRKFIRLDINTPEGIKYIVLPVLDREIVTPITDEEAHLRAKLVINSYLSFRKSTRDIIIYERIRYSAIYWITLRKSKYQNIDTRNIIWHYYQKNIDSLSHFEGSIPELNEYFKNLEITANFSKLSGYYATGRYLVDPSRAKYYVFPLIYGGKKRYIIAPVKKVYHDASNRPIKEYLTYYARSYLKKNSSAVVIAGKSNNNFIWSYIEI